MLTDNLICKRNDIMWVQWNSATEALEICLEAIPPTTLLRKCHTSSKKGVLTLTPEPYIIYMATVDILNSHSECAVEWCCLVSSASLNLSSTSKSIVLLPCTYPHAACGLAGRVVNKQHNNCMLYLPPRKPSASHTSAASGGETFSRQIDLYSPS